MPSYLRPSFTARACGKISFHTCPNRVSLFTIGDWPEPLRAGRRGPHVYSVQEASPLLLFASVGALSYYDLLNKSELFDQC